MKWRDCAKLIIADEIERCCSEGITDPQEIRRCIRDKYPFGERSHHPYKIWLSEVKKQMKPFDGEMDMPLFEVKE